MVQRDAGPTKHQMQQGSREVYITLQRKGNAMMLRCSAADSIAVMVHSHAYISWLLTVTNIPYQVLSKPTILLFLCFGKLLFPGQNACCTWCRTGLACSGTISPSTASNFQSLNSMSIWFGKAHSMDLAWPIKCSSGWAPFLGSFSP